MKRVELSSLVAVVYGLLGCRSSPPEVVPDREDEKRAGELAESILRSFVEAIPRSVLDEKAGTWTATVDFKEGPIGSSPWQCSFVLPKLNTDLSNRVHYPGGIRVPVGYEPEELRSFGPFLNPTHPEHPFSFSFSIKKVHTLQYLEGNEKPDHTGKYSREELDPLVKLYEVAIFVHRTPATASSERGELPLLQVGVRQKLVATLTATVSRK